MRLQAVVTERFEPESSRARTITARFGPVPRSITQYSATMNTPLMHGLRHIASMHLTGSPSISQPPSPFITIEP
jgi:hypothetical protein